MSKINLSRRGLFGLFAGAAAVAVAPKVVAEADLFSLDGLLRGDFKDRVDAAMAIQRRGAWSTSYNAAWARSRVYEVGDSIFHGTGEGAVTWECVNPEGFEPLEALDWAGAA